MRRSGFAYAVPLFVALKMAFWSRFMGEMSSCWASRSVFFRKVILYTSRSPQPQWSRRDTTQEKSGKHNGLANGNCLLQGNFRKDSFKLEVGELAHPSSSSAVGFREHFLPVTATVMLFSSLVLVRCYVFPLPVSATVILFSRVVLDSSFVFLTCLYAFMDV